MDLRFRPGVELVAIALCAASALRAAEAPPVGPDGGVKEEPGASERAPRSPVGVERMVIGEYIRGRMGPLQDCYSKRLNAVPSLQGKLIIRFDIGTDGSVIRASADGIPDRLLVDCVVAQILQWQFPKPASGVKLRVAYPLVFKPGW